MVFPSNAIIDRWFGPVPGGAGVVDRCRNCEARRRERGRARCISVEFVRIS